MVQWPAIVKVAGDPEFELIHSLQQCRQLLQPQQGALVWLIDSAGIVRRWPELNVTRLELSQLTDWAREHAAAAQQCCVAKIHLSQAADAVSFVESLDA